MAKYDKKRILELREQGKTYKNIAEEVGCSKQYVGLVCGKTNPNKFRYIQNDQCIYPNLRKWMNDNKISRKALIRISKCYESTGSSVHLSHFLQGVTEPTKQVIDRLIETTGLPYEVLFSKVECQSSVAVVVHGHFENITGGMVMLGDCSECKVRQPVIETYYCKNCGAKMDGDGNG